MVAKAGGKATSARVFLTLAVGFPTLAANAEAGRDSETMDAARDSIADIMQESPAWAQDCGWGRFYTMDVVSFSHVVSFTFTMDEESGFLIDCYTGTEAYLDYSYTSDDGRYVYIVTGQLGDYQ